MDASANTKNEGFQGLINIEKERKIFKFPNECQQTEGKKPILHILENINKSSFQCLLLKQEVELLNSYFQYAF